MPLEKMRRDVLFSVGHVNINPRHHAAEEQQGLRHANSFGLAIYMMLAVSAAAAL
ncbi:unnamed protein product [Ectocarpus sp. CCAP 1310/34]|nr:unnamed protein product [Ectocarpus sp. CCAP 1310/34]